jgi:hypothetical protein
MINTKEEPDYTHRERHKGIYLIRLGQKHRKVALFLGQFCGQTPVAEQVVALEHLLVVLSVLLEVLPQLD